MKQFLIGCRCTFDGTAIVEAESAEEALAKFEQGAFEFDSATASMCDWESRGEPEEDK